MKKSLAVLVAAFAVVSVLSSQARAELSDAQKGHIGAELNFWWPTMSGDASFDGVDLYGYHVDGSSLDLDDVLGLDQTITTFELGLWVSPIKRLKFSLYWFMDKRTGSNVVDTPIKIGGETYGVGTTIDSSIELQRYKLMSEFALFRNDIFKIALGSGIVYIDAIAHVSGTTSGGYTFDSEGQRLQVPLPVVGGSVEVMLPIPKINIGAFVEGAGMGLMYKDVGATYFDVRGGAVIKTRFIYALAGYQYIGMEASAFDLASVNMTLQGPFVSVGAKF